MSLDYKRLADRHDFQNRRVWRDGSADCMDRKVHNLAIDRRPNICTANDQLSVSQALFNVLLVPRYLLKVRLILLMQGCGKPLDLKFIMTDLRG